MAGQTFLSRKVIRRFLVLAVLVLGMWLSANALNSRYANHFIATFIEKESQRHLDGVVRVQETAFDFVPTLRVTLSNIEIKDPTGVLASVGVLEASIDWLDILLNFLNRTEIAIEGLDGNPNVERWKRFLRISDQPTKSLDRQAWISLIQAPPIKSVKISDNRIPITAGDFGFGISNAMVTATYSSDGSPIVAATVRSMSIYEEGRMIIEGLDARIPLRLEENRISSQNFILSSPEIDLRSDLNAQLDFRGPKEELGPIKFSCNTGVDGDLAVLAKFLDIEKTTRGSVQATSKLTGTIGGPKNQSPFLFDIDAHVKDGVLGNISLYDTEAALTISKDEILYRKGTITAENFQGSFDGRMSLRDEKTFTFSADFHQMELSDLMRALNINFDAVDTTLETDNLILSGQIEPYHMSIRGDVVLEELNFPNVPSDGRPRPTCQTKLELYTDDFHFDFGKPALSCSTPGSSQSQVQFSGQIAFDGNKATEIDILSENFDYQIAGFLLQKDIRGNGQLDVRVSGSKSVKTTTRINATIGNLGFGNWIGGPFKTRLAIDEEKLRWEDLEYQSSTTGHINSEGSYKFETKTLRTNSSLVNLSKQEVFEISKSLDIPLFATADIDRLQADIKAPVNSPELTEGLVNFDLSNIELDQKIFGSYLSGSLRGSFAQLALNIDEFRHKDFHLRGKFSGSRDQIAGFGPEWFAKLKLKSFETSFESVNGTHGSFSAIKPMLSEELQQLDIDSLLNLKGQFSGDANSITGIVTTSLKNLSAYGWQANQAFAKLKVSGKKGLKWKIDFWENDQSLSASTSLDFSNPETPYKLALSVNRLDLLPIIKRINPETPHNLSKTELSANLTADGTVDNWLASNADLKLTNVWIQLRNKFGKVTRRSNIRLREPVSAALQRGTIVADKDLELHSRYGDIHFKPSGYLPGVISTKTTLKIDASLLQLIFTQVQESSGWYVAELETTGKIDNFKTNVVFRNLKREEMTRELWRPCNIAIEGFTPRLENIQIDVINKDDVFQINNFTAYKGEGSILARGRLAFKRGSEGVINILFERIKFTHSIPYLKVFETIVSGEIEVTGRRRPYHVSGNIIVDKSRSLQPLDLKQELAKALRSTTPTPESAETRRPLFDMNIAIEANRSLIVKNKTVSAVGSAFVELNGSNIRPVVTGYVKIDKGKVFYKREFDLSRAEITFDDIVKINPRIDFFATSKVSEYEVSLVVSGTMSEPVVDIYVDPPTREDGTPISRLDALILLSKGSLPSLGSQVSEGQGVGVAEAINIYASQLPISEIVNSFNIGEELFFVEIDFATDSQGSPVPRFNLQIKLIDAINTTYRRTFDQAELIAELPLNENVSINGSVKELEDDGSANQTNRELDVGVRFSFPFN